MAMENYAVGEQALRAMDRLVAFWRRQLGDEILVSFVRHRRRSNALDWGTEEVDGVSAERTPLYDDLPGMLRRFECSLDEAAPVEELGDDALNIPETEPEDPFGCGWVGAMFGARMHALTSTYETITYNEPVITDWAQLEELEFDENGEWPQSLLNALRYFVEHATRRYSIRLWELLDGANFVGLMRGTTQLYYDLADRPPEMSALYDLGFTAACRMFDLKREIVRDHNLSVFQHQPFYDLAPGYGLPWTDTDAYTACAPRVFAEVGFENKQRILDRYGGGELFIHGLGRHLVPIAVRLRGLTQLHLYDDPKCPTYFSLRNRMRQETHDLPLAMDCELGEFADALAEGSLPGGVHYGVFVPDDVETGDLRRLLQRVRAYRALELPAKPA